MDHLEEVLKEKLGDSSLPTTIVAVELEEFQQEFEERLGVAPKLPERLKEFPKKFLKELEDKDGIK